jgi:DDE superfamily endonuclease
MDVQRGARLLMDNVAFHHSASTLDAMRCRGFIPLYTPPYSPKLNAIENVFGVVKMRFRRACPVMVDMSLDYCQLMENVLAEPLDTSPFFQRVMRLIQSTLKSSALGFKGYDV